MKKTKMQYIWLMPLLFILVIFVAVPLCITIVDSLYGVSLLHLDKRIFVGLRNYIDLLQDKVTINSFGNSLFYLTVSLIAETIVGIVIALALKDKFIGRGIVLAILVIPWALPPLINGIIWRLILEPTCGLWNDLFLKMGVIDAYRVWLNNPEWSKWLVTLVHVWKMLPLIVIIFLAKLQTLPEDRIEAARMDGANYWQCFWYIIFPFIKPVLVITLAEGTISAFHLFDEAYVMTGTAMDTRSLLIQNYLVAFREMNLGSGMALSALISLFSILLMAIYIKLGGKNES